MNLTETAAIGWLEADGIEGDIHALDHLAAYQARVEAHEKRVAAKRIDQAKRHKKDKKRGGS